MPQPSPVLSSALRAREQSDHNYGLSKEKQPTVMDAGSHLSHHTLETTLIPSTTASSIPHPLIPPLILFLKLMITTKVLQLW